jgi:hypothetical protein
MAKPEKLDLYQVHKAEYVAPKKPVLIQAQPAKYLTFAGKGKPGGPEFQAGIGALYAMAFTIKMTKKFAGQDYKVCHLEGLYRRRAEQRSARRPPKRWSGNCSFACRTSSRRGI